MYKAARSQDSGPSPVSRAPQPKPETQFPRSSFLNNGRAFISRRHCPAGRSHGAENSVPSGSGTNPLLLEEGHSLINVSRL